MEVLISPAQNEGMKPSHLLQSLFALQIAVGAQPLVHIRVFDYARLPGDDLKAFETTASKILRWTGINSQWLHCPISGTLDSVRGCSGPIGGTDVSIRILPNSKAGEMHTLGTSLANAEGGSYSTMYLPTVKRAAAATGVALPEMLALATLHELGHLILGVDSHTSEGIMHPQWTGKEIGAMMNRNRLFSAAQSRDMRRRLMVRAGSPQ